MSEILSAYVEGLMTKCAAYGVDPEWLVKNAVLEKLVKSKTFGKQVMPASEGGPGWLSKRKTPIKKAPIKTTKPTVKRPSKALAQQINNRLKMHARQGQPKPYEPPTPPAVKLKANYPKAETPRSIEGRSILESDIKPVPAVTPTPVINPEAAKPITAVAAPTTPKLGLLARGAGHPLTVAAGLGAGAYGASRIADPIIDSTGETGGNLLRTIRNGVTGREWNADWLDPEVLK